jgi:hypothetical protein
MDKYESSAKCFTVGVIGCIIIFVINIVIMLLTVILH